MSAKQATPAITAPVPLIPAPTVQSSFELLGEEFLTPTQIAQLSGKSERTVDWWRETHQGPPFIRLGKSIFYRKSAFLAWLIAQEITPRKSRKAGAR